MRLFLALRPQHQTTGSELYNTSNRMTPDGLANLPRDYTGLPKAAPQLGPPLPGDLGRPIANAGAPAPGMPTPAAGPTAEQQRIAQEQEAARTSHLFATTNVGQVAPAAIPGSAGGQAACHGRRLGRSDVAGSQARLPERQCRSPHSQSRSRRAARQSLRAASRRGDPRGADHRTALRPAWPGHCPGHRGCLRQPDRTGSPDPAGCPSDRSVRRPDRLRPDRERCWSGTA